MREEIKFKRLLDKIDLLLEQYESGELHPEKRLNEILLERSNQRPLLEKTIKMITEGLKKYPFNTELLRRRAFAKFRIVTPNGEFPFLAEAEEDLRIILKISPNDLYSGFDLINEMSTFSFMEDIEIAEMAEEFANLAKNLMISSLALQIKSLIYADKNNIANEVYNKWIKIFPDSDLLKEAKDIMII